MDHTSENDYIVNSCILNTCNKLEEEQKTQILSIIREVYEESKPVAKRKTEEIEKLLLKDPAEFNIKKFFEF